MPTTSSSLPPACDAAPADAPSEAPTSPREHLARLRRELSQELFDHDGLATVFAHARNVLTATLIVAAGMYAARQLAPVHGFGLQTLHVAGCVVSGLGVVLLLLNLVDGMRRLARRRHPLALRLAAILVYLALSVRLVQVIVYFRAGF